MEVELPAPTTKASWVYKCVQFILKFLRHVKIVDVYRFKPKCHKYVGPPYKSGMEVTRVFKNTTGHLYWSSHVDTDINMPPIISIFLEMTLVFKNTTHVPADMSERLDVKFSPFAISPASRHSFSLFFFTLYSSCSDIWLLTISLQWVDLLLAPQVLWWFYFR